MDMSSRITVEIARGIDLVGSMDVGGMKTSV
jgi:hypothetical protein